MPIRMRVFGPVRDDLKTGLTPHPLHIGQAVASFSPGRRIRLVWAYLGLCTDN